MSIKLDLIPFFRVESIFFVLQLLFPREFLHCRGARQGNWEVLVNAGDRLFKTLRGKQEQTTSFSWPNLNNVQPESSRTLADTNTPNREKMKSKSAACEI